MATQSHTEQASGGSSGLPQLNFETYPSQIFWLFVSLFILWWLMSKLALPRISSVLEERADAITDDLDRAEELRRKAEVAEEEYQQALRNARARAQEIAQKKREEMHREIEKKEEEADRRIAEKVEDSEKRIAEIRESALASVDEVARETALAIIERLAPDLADRQAVDNAVSRQL